MVIKIKVRYKLLIFQFKQAFPLTGEISTDLMFLSLLNRNILLNELFPSNCISCERYSSQSKRLHFTPMQAEIATYTTQTTQAAYVSFYLLTPWGRVLLEKLPGLAANQEIPRILCVKFSTFLSNCLQYQRLLFEESRVSAEHHTIRVT